jgi:hypothetical protein
MHMTDSKVICVSKSIFFLILMTEKYLSENNFNLLIQNSRIEILIIKIKTSFGDIATHIEFRIIWVVEN